MIATAREKYGDQAEERVVSLAAAREKRAAGKATAPAVDDAEKPEPARKAKPQRRMVKGYNHTIYLEANELILNEIGTHIEGPPL